MDDQEAREILESLTSEELELGKQLLSVHRSLRKRIGKAYRSLNSEQARARTENVMRVICSFIAIGQINEGTGPLEQMDIANALVLSCVRNNTILEDLHHEYISDSEMEELNKGCVANVSDWLIVTAALAKQPNLFEMFIHGSLVWGGSSWERDRVRIVSKLFEWPSEGFEVA